MGTIVPYRYLQYVYIYRDAFNIISVTMPSEGLGLGGGGISIGGDGSVCIMRDGFYWWRDLLEMISFDKKGLLAERGVG
jgi:hypothetical protein